MEEREAIRKMFRENPDAADWIRQALESGTIQGGQPAADDEINVVAGRTPVGIDRSKQCRCEDCNAIVWISPSTQAMIAAHPKPVHILCIGCVLKRAQACQ